MIVLGLNSFGHDAAAVLLVDGHTAFATSQERCDRVRHSAAFPAQAIRAALQHAGVDAGEVDAVAFPWTRGMGRAPKLWHWLRHLPRSMAYLREPPDTLLPDRRSYLRAMRGVRGALRAEGLRAPLHRIPHHRAHAASALLALPEQRGAVLTADGMGEWTTAAAWHGDARSLRRLRRAVYPHSPGKAYAAVTAWLGFRPESDEGKTMGLASYGTSDSDGARFARGLLRPDARRLLRLRLKHFGFPWGEARLFGDAFLEALGPARTGHGEPRTGDADVAQGIQTAVEGLALDAAQRLLAETGARHLGLAGGLFLNCAMNGLLRRRLDADVVPFPIAGDAGAAWGAASLTHQRLTGRAAEALGDVRLGHALRAAECRAAAEPLGARLVEDQADLACAVAARIHAGRVLAVARDRAEFGPRALGARSILATPVSTADRDRVNGLKGRERWRPLAPIVLEEDRGWFGAWGPSPYMILTFEATDAGRRDIPAVVHVDGTARVQTVGHGPGDAFLRAVLLALEARGHPAAVINTSLNRPGEPIVNTAAEAVAAARAMELDGLVLGNWLYDREPFASDL